MGERTLRYDDVKVGDQAPPVEHKLTRTDLVMYAGASGDFNPMHTDEVAAKAAGLPSDCLQCNVRFACNGECPKHRFTQTASGEYGLNYLCAGYKHFFHHIDPYMRFMAEELKQNRAPARVMEWARERKSVPPLFAAPQKKAGVVFA